MYMDDIAAPGMLFPERPADRERLALIPEIRRARDFRLYAAGEKRLLDLWLWGGAAVLGHTPPALLRELKNTAQRGLFAPFPGHWSGRFGKALARLFPGRVCRFYATDAALCRALEGAGYSAPPQDPVFSALSPSDPPPPLSLWRPFAGGETPLAVPGDIPVLIPLLPLPWAGAPRVAAVLPARADPFPPSGILSPVILAAAARAVHDLAAAAGKAPPGDFPKIDAALRSGPWRRRGIYLCRAEPPDNAAYTALFRRFLGAGFLLPPSPRLPLILPQALSPGEEARLAGLLAGGPDQ